MAPEVIAFGEMRETAIQAAPARRMIIENKVQRRKCEGYMWRELSVNGLKCSVKPQEYLDKNDKYGYYINTPPPWGGVEEDHG